MRSGLTSEEARRRLASGGPNTMPDTAVHPLRRALATLGVAMAPLPVLVVAGVLVVAVAFALTLDLVKVPVFARLGIA